MVAPAGRPGSPPGEVADLRLAAAHVIVDAAALADGDGPVLDPDDAHHLARVLRLRPGQVVTATDGAGRWRRYRWRGEALGRLLDPDGPVHETAAPTPQITVGFAPVKGDRPEWTVQKLTELGVDRIVVLQAARSVVRWEGNRGVQQLERLRRVVREASMQSRRCHVPLVCGVSRPGDVAEAALAHFGGEPLSLRRPTVLIGPEGGWAESELEAGRPTVSLGPLVLRAETAAVAAGVLLTSLRHGIVDDFRHSAWSATESEATIAASRSVEGDHGSQ